MVRSQQKKKTEAAAQKAAEETSDMTEDDQNLNENRGVEEMETETETETKKKDFEEVPIADLPQKPTLAQEREEEFAFVRRKTDRSSWKGKTSTYSTGRHTGGSGKRGKTESSACRTDR